MPEHTTRTGPARAELADAVRDDLTAVAQKIREAGKLLKAIGEESGGINGLGNRCRSAIQQLDQLAGAWDEAAEEYHRALTQTKAVAVVEEARDEELSEKVKQAKAEAAA